MAKLVLLIKIVIRNYDLKFFKVKIVIINYDFKFEVKIIVDNYGNNLKHYFEKGIEFIYIF